MKHVFQCANINKKKQPNYFFNTNLNSKTKNYYLCISMATISNTTKVAEGVYKEKSSKFLSFAHHVESIDEAKAIVAKYRKEHHKARHVCFAYRIGKDGSIYRAADDGEPSGTAGRPILKQLEGAGLTNSMIVVVRYFGGTLLGTGGLVRAYKEAAADVLAQVVITE